MRWIGTAHQWLIPAFVFILVPHTHALKLTKDTVRESTIQPTQIDYATWNDSLSLINTTNETLNMEAIHFIVPQGKEAHLRIGYKVPYRSMGNAEGPVIRSGQPYRFFLDSDKKILPGERIPITGFFMETCIDCPTGGGPNPNARQDTLRTYVIFETNVSRDTLVVSGTISATSSGIHFPAPPSKSPSMNKKKRSRQHRFFNSLGRSDNQARTATGDPVIVKFFKIGEDRR